ncbi:hypothetical protein PMKS-002549 [Pichia membranifaciens]|uniref:Magnesium transporter n=1 Tax=Pichia membranifaciens TaxID=4926 RepID=A0A1Q2YHP4_9ASCO|nr:hypothetical protein PMKS-002549 [Pichia membranifaciens]
MQPQIYDSADPNLPNLPDNDQILWSDYDDYLSNRPSSDSYSESESDHEHRKNDRNRVRAAQSPAGSSKKHSSRKSAASSRRSSEKSHLRRPMISIFGPHDEHLPDDSGSDSDVGNDGGKNSKRSHQQGNIDDMLNEKESAHSLHSKGRRSQRGNSRLRSNSTGARSTHNSSESSHASAGSSAEDNNESVDSDHKQRERSGSIFSMLHIPRIMHRTLSSMSRRKSDIAGRSANNLTRTESEMHSCSTSSSPILQPTTSHALAAGADPDDAETQPYSYLPPGEFYDEEACRPEGPEAYLDRDVRYDNEQNDNETILDSNSSALSRSTNPSGDQEGYDDANLSDVEDNVDDTDDKNKKGTDRRAYKIISHQNTDVASGGSIKRTQSRVSGKSVGSRQVEIDKRKRKVMKTDTDDESTFQIPSNSQYQPESILKRGSDLSRVKTGHTNVIAESENVNDNDRNSSDDIEVGSINQPPTHRARKKRAARRRRRKSRKYIGSQSKKERTAWEPGIDLRTTNVFLNSPGSIITITDYSKVRYRISHYDLYSEMSPKYSKFMTDDTILSAHDFDEDEDYDNNSPEYNDFLNYMNKVSDSRKAVEEAIEEKPMWSQVRWININGLSWEAISILGKKYNLHPLSVEDLVDIPQRTKMDIYQQHLFVVMPLMKLLKVKKVSDESNITYFERIRKNIREFASGESSKSFSPSPTNVPNSSNMNREPTKNSNQSTGNSTEVPPSPPKVMTKTIATKEQLSREFSRTSTKSVAPALLVPPSPLTPPSSSGTLPPTAGNSANIYRALSDSALGDEEFSGSAGNSNNHNKNNGKKSTSDDNNSSENQLNRIRSGYDDNILPRSNKTFKKPAVYTSEEEYLLAVEIERASSGRRLTDLTFITHSSTKYKSRMTTLNRMRPLMAKSLAVGVEQSSIYLTADGTVLSFFEHSAMDIERAILSRLSAEYTILRETCNPSILFHSVLDANVDLLYPVVTAYSRILNEKELEILTAALPDLQHTQELHLMLNELGILKNSILPISSLITQLKDISMDPTSQFIDESCKLYLADIGDHLLAFIDEIDSMSSTIENLIDLIFNTLSVETNNSMQRLSLVSVLFLPLTFWAGYFGMNFKSFGNLDYNVNFFWKLAIPFTAGMMILLMRNSCYKIVIHIKRLLLSYWNGLQQLRQGTGKLYAREKRFNPERLARLRAKSRKRD